VRPRHLSSPARATFSAAAVLAGLVAGAGGSACGGRAAPPREAPAGSARDFVEAVYASHDPARAEVAPWSEARCPTTFTASLCALLEADRRRAGDGPPNLDGDPLYGAQEIDVSDLSLRTESEEPERASIQVFFRNVDRPKALRLTVVRGPEGWRIDDIEYRHQSPPVTLREVLEEGR
jgi:hypothetical protein